MSRKLVGAFALFLLFPLGGCEDSAGVGGSASLSIFLTDDPGFLEAWVNISRVELVGGGEGEGDGVLVLRENLGDYDLLTLANHAEILVDGETVPVGTYSQLRFVIPQACIVLGEVVDGMDVPSAVYASPGYDKCEPENPGQELVRGDLQLPSFDQTGIKVQLPNDLLTVEGERAWLVDFDVSESFGHEAGNSEKWVMHPVIKGEDMSLSGSIEVQLTLGTGMTLPPIEQDGIVIVPEPTLADYFQASLDDDPRPVAFTATEPEGTYSATFPYVLPGDHNVWVGLKEDLSLSYVLDPDVPETVSVTSSQDEIVSFVVGAPEGT